MKHFKITSVMLSAVMCVSMLATPVAVVADETPASETQTEVTEKQEPEETEKPASKETEKKETEATEKTEEAEPAEENEPSETEAQESEVPEGQTSNVEAKDKFKSKSQPTIIYSCINTGSTWAVTCELDDKGLLTIKGEGKIPDDLLGDLSYRDKIKSIVITGNKITRIDDLSFYGYSNLESIKIPSSVKVIGEDAFCKCEKLKKVELANGLEFIHCNAFQGCKSLKEISIPDSVTFIYAQAFKDCTGLEKVKLSNKMHIIEYELFYGCTSLTSISIPNGVTKINFRAFNGCTKLTGVSLPETLTYIDDDVFNGCTSLKSIYLPDSITFIAGGVFQGCTSLESVTLPTGIDSVSAYLFYDCTSLKRVDIPKTVTLVFDAFENNPALTEVNYGGVKDDVTINPSSVDITKIINYETKSTNTLTVSGKTYKIKYKKIKKKAKKASRASVLNVNHPKGNVTYKLVSVSKKKFKKYFKISSAGAVSVKKKLKKGTYTIKCTVSAAGNENYKPVTKTVSFKIKVK